MDKWHFTLNIMVKCDNGDDDDEDNDDISCNMTCHSEGRP
jgi:hypothetical protein